MGSTAARIGEFGIIASGYDKVYTCLLVAKMVSDFYQQIGRPAGELAVLDLGR
jgi:hypothetical protein